MLTSITRNTPNFSKLTCTDTHTRTASPLKISAHTSCCCWAGGGVSFGLMSFWLMLSASLLNVWLLLLHLSPLSTQSPHPSVLRPRPGGGHPPLTASSGCFLLLLWSPSQCTHTFVFGQLRETLIYDIRPLNPKASSKDLC